jgi:hypothetical protein
MGLIRFLPGGGVRKLFAAVDRQTYPGLIPQRASRVEVIQEGPLRGRFSVEFLELPGLTPCCLVETFEDHAAGVRAEQTYLKEQWLGYVDCD